MIELRKLYRSLKKVSGEWHGGNLLSIFSRGYYKFYEDGYLIYCSTDAEGQDLPWFNRESYDMYHGKYELNGLKIDGIIYSSNGDLTFSGMVKNSSILIEVSNTSINYRSWEFLEPHN